MKPHLVADTARYHHLDALRGFAMLLGIVLHGLLSFTFLPIWPAQDIHQNTAVYGFIQHAIHGFRMPLFFLLSGFFTAMLWRRRGIRQLIRHRAKRILLPLIIGTVLVWPMMIGVSQWGATAKANRQQARTQNTRSPATQPDLWTAARHGDVAALRHALDQGADVNERDPMRVSPLEWAAMQDRPDAIECLVQNGADINARNPDGSTALHASAFLGRIKATQKLVALGADPTIQNNRGDSPLDAARVDMGIVRFITGILQIQFDEATVTTGKRETAAFLAGLEATSPDPENQVAPEAATTDGTHPGIPGPNTRSSSSQRDQTLGTLLAIYLRLTFFPLFHHLWFLYYLLWLLVIFLAAIPIGRWIPLRTPRWMISAPWCLAWLLPITLVPQFFMTQTFGADTAPGLLPWPPKLIYYAVFFGFGALCFGRPEFEKNAGRSWGIFLAAAVPVLLFGLYLLDHNQANPAARSLVSLCAVAYAWLMIFGMIGFFQRCFHTENRMIRYLSDASYWLYLAHLPLIIALQAWVSNWHIHHFPKFLLVCTATFAILLVTYECFVRYTFIGAALNGRKSRPPREMTPKAISAGQTRYS